MDTLTFVIFLLLLALAINANQSLLAVGIAAVMVVMIRPISLGILVLVGALLMVWIKNSVEFWWVILGVLMLLAFVMDKNKGAGPEMYTPEMLMGG